MKLNKEIKDKIDNLDYQAMLSKWRFSPVGDSMFEGESGEYFENRMNELKKQLSDNEVFTISKRIGW